MLAIRKIFSVSAKRAPALSKRINAEKWVKADEDQTATILVAFQEMHQHGAQNLLRLNPVTNRSPFWTRISSSYVDQSCTMQLELVDPPDSPVITYNALWRCTQEAPGKEWVCYSRQWAMPVATASASLARENNAEDKQQK